MRQKFNILGRRETILIILLMISPAYAVPQVMPFSGSLKDSAGNPVSGSHTFVFGIYNTSTGSVPLYSETQSINLQNGEFTVLIGNTTPINLTFSSQLYLGIKADNDSEMSSRIRLATHPYAFRANYSEEALTLNCTDCLDTRQIADIFVLSAGGAIAGNLNFSGNNITNITAIVPASDLKITGNIDMLGRNITNVDRINGGRILTSNITSNLDFNQFNISNVNAINPSGSGIVFGGDAITRNLIPAINNLYTLGASGFYFSNAYITILNMAGQINSRNIIPAENNLYTLGDPTHYFSNAFIGSLNLIFQLTDSQIENDITANLTKSVGQVSDSQIAGVADTKIAGSGTLISNLNSDLLDNKNGSYYLDASNLNAGTLLPARLPNLNQSLVTIDATNITTGTIVPARLPTLNQSLVTIDATNITSGTIIPARLPNLNQSLVTIDATNITTGTIIPARLPNLNQSLVTIDAANITSGVLGIARGGTNAGSFSAGSVVFANSTALTQDNSNFYWDDTNNNLGLGTISPFTLLHLVTNTSDNGTLNYMLTLDRATSSSTNGSS
ncbi:MAG: hypothetical protein HYX24_02100, partial [Candidatus Aenigmarchaeota archaeon]|nr:hypothetical protein [Candidatus Aenigmarchaeota archaeon]